MPGEHNFKDKLYMYIPAKQAVIRDAVVPANNALMTRLAKSAAL